MLLRSCSMRPNRPNHAHRSKLRQQTPYRAPLRRRRQPARVHSRDHGRRAVAVAEAEIHHSPGEDDANKFRKDCRTYLSVLGGVLFVPVILSLASPSRFPLGWQFCPAPGIPRCYCATLVVLLVGTGLMSLRASPFGEEDHKR